MTSVSFPSVLFHCHVSVSFIGLTAVCDQIVKSSLDAMVCLRDVAVWARIQLGFVLTFLSLRHTRPRGSKCNGNT